MSEVIITILAVLFLLYAIPKGFSILGDTYRDGFTGRSVFCSRRKVPCLIPWMWVHTF